tara:strand:- start:58278 stop:58931 length:654 start_codon:yes stop_codon:yes gene_type:complete
MEVTNRSADNRVISFALLFSFFVSGCSALMYQMSWQRSLYGVIGVDIDSITIIVSVFMLGIGFGGMLGGWLADRFPSSRLVIYAASEFGIAAYGLMTLWLLPWMEVVLGQLSWGGAGLSAVASFTFLIVPTTLMGVTLPILTMEFNERYGNVGVSVGTLYFFNTFGASVGAALVPFVLLPMMSLPHVIFLAVLGNVAVALCGVVAGRNKVDISEVPA